MHNSIAVSRVHHQGEYNIHHKREQRRTKTAKKYITTTALFVKMALPPLTAKGLDALVIVMFILSIVGLLAAILALETVFTGEVLPGISPEDAPSANRVGTTRVGPTYKSGTGISVTDDTISLEQLDGRRLLVNSTNESAPPLPTSVLSPYELLLGGGRSSLLPPTNPGMSLLTVDAGEPKWLPYVSSAGPFPIALESGDFGGGTGFLSNFDNPSAVAFPYQFDSGASPLSAAIRVTFELTTKSTGTSASFTMNMNDAFPPRHAQAAEYLPLVQGTVVVNETRWMAVLHSTFVSGILTVNMSVQNGDSGIVSLNQVVTGEMCLVFSVVFL
jgi:hypothetical protein